MRHDLALPPGQEARRVAGGSESAAECRCAVERSEMRLQQLQDQAFPLAEISLAEDAELSRPAPVAVEGDVDLVRDAVFSVVQVEVRLNSQAAREDVGERDRPRAARLPSPKLDGARASPPSVVHAAPLVQGSEPGLISVLDLPVGR